MVRVDLKSAPTHLDAIFFQSSGQHQKIRLVRNRNKCSLDFHKICHFRMQLRELITDCAYKLGWTKEITFYNSLIWCGGHIFLFLRNALEIVSGAKFFFTCLLCGSV